MPEESAKKTTQSETGVDVFEHEIEDLERSVWKSTRVHPLIVIAGASVIAFCLGAGFFMLTNSPSSSQGGTSTIMTIDVHAPRSGTIAARPNRFEWESTARTSNYVVTIQERGSPRDLIVRQVDTNSLDLTEDEATRLVKGGSYTWRVRARSSEGWTVGEGGGQFTF